MGPDLRPVDAAILLQATDDIPPIVAKPLQESFGGIPGVEHHRRGAAVQAIAGIAEPLEG
jgi:hypothetical protein